LEQRALCASSNGARFDNHPARDRRRIDDRCPRFAVVIDGADEAFQIGKIAGNHRHDVGIRAGDVMAFKHFGGQFELFQKGFFARLHGRNADDRLYRIAHFLDVDLGAYSLYDAAFLEALQSFRGCRDRQAGRFRKRLE